MPVNSYTVLNVLANGGESYEINAVKEALQGFSLFAFILYDPVKHQHFQRHLEANFDRLDYETGNKLLFFTLLDPPEQWLRHAERRNYYQRYQSYYQNEIANHANAPTSQDSSLSTYLLAKSLNIDFDDLPCIIFTDNFKKQNFWWVKTNEYSLNVQLRELGYFASRFPFTETHYENETLQVSMSKLLSDNLSVILASNSRYSMHQTYKNATLVIKKLFRELRQETLSDSDESSNYERVAETLFLLLGLASDCSNQILSQIRLETLPIPENYLEYESNLILKTGFRVFHLLFSESNFLETLLFDEQDYSPGIISFTKFFENEVNLSLVHFMRKYKGIILPDYFKKVQPNLLNVYINRANLNKENNEKWEPPALGTSMHAFKEVYLKELPPAWSTQDCEYFVNNWETIQQIRNPAAHASIRSKSDMELLLQSLNDLNKQDYFRKLSLLKDEYRGDAHA